MFTVDDFIFGGIVHTALYRAKLERQLEMLRSDNLILPKNIFKMVGTDSAAFYVDENINTIQDGMTQYSLHDIRPSDVVLDIGACIGAFSLNVCNRVNHVYAVEPVMTDALIKNIEFNHAKNITVFECALGAGESTIEWYGHSKTVSALSLEDIIKLCGGHVDFIKCDCEGGEWCMTLPSIYNVRRMELDVHNFNGLYKFRDFENLLISSGFDHTQRMLSSELMLISAKNRYID